MMREATPSSATATFPVDGSDGSQTVQDNGFIGNLTVHFGVDSVNATPISVTASGNYFGIGGAVVGAATAASINATGNYWGVNGAAANASQYDDTMSTGTITVTGHLVQNPFSDFPDDSTP
jgi:hypothetical protein